MEIQVSDETEGQREFRRLLLNLMGGLCPCGRVRAVRGACCTKCGGADFGHSAACDKRNPEGAIAS